jgi:hypothetical protein
VCLLRWASCHGDSRLPAVCRGNSGEAGDAEPENLDSGPQVSFNLLCVDGLGGLWWCGACLVQIRLVNVPAGVRPSNYI